MNKDFELVLPVPHYTPEMLRSKAETAHMVRPDGVHHMGYTQETIKSPQTAVLIGANGSGKTRLGVWIELKSPQQQKAYRISAHRVLQMPDRATPTDLNLATKGLLFEHGEANSKSNGKWGNKPATHPIQDFDRIINFLFSDATEKNAEFVAACKLTSERLAPPITKLYEVKAIWEAILPHRELVIEGLHVRTKVRGGQDGLYNASEMSAGERVAFYLIAHCLAAPDNGIIIVDEPELHLHKSVQLTLWSKIQQLRPDCLFVYITHDIDFAAAQENAMRVWIKSYDGFIWDWEIVEPDATLPDALLLELLGNRRDVVFVEGSNTSQDASFYRELLPDYLVKPREGCEQVVQTVKAFEANKQLHHMKGYGIIDRDRRMEAEITALEKHGIFVLSVAEVENLFCTKEILAIVSRQLERDAEADFRVASDKLFDVFKAQLETQVSKRVAYDIRYRLKRFDEQAMGETALTAKLQSVVEDIDVKTLYSNCRAEFTSILHSRDYKRLLLVFNEKELPDKIQFAFGLAKSKGALSDFVIRLAKGERRAEIIEAVRHYFGSFAPYM